MAKGHVDNRVRKTSTGSSAVFQTYGIEYFFFSYGIVRYRGVVIL